LLVFVIRAISEPWLFLLRFLVLAREAPAPNLHTSLFRLTLLDPFP
jgi:hypothetical protein